MFCISGVYIATLDFYFCRSGVEVFIFKFADSSAVHGVGKFAAEFLDIEFVRAKTNFLVWIETYADFAVLNFWVSLQPCHSINDFRDSSLIIGSEERIAIGDDQVLTDIVQKLGKFFRREFYIFLSVEFDHRAVVVLYDAWIHVLARHVGRCIHMGYEADGRKIL